MKTFIAIAVSILFGLVMISRSLPSEHAAAPIETAAVAPEPIELRQAEPPPAIDPVMMVDALGCESAETFDRIAQMIDDGDTEAASKALIPELLAGSCVKIPVGAKVIVRDTAWFKGRRLVRTIGDPVEYWVPSHTVAL